MADDQTAAFVTGEGDRYFQRNRSVVFNADADPVCRLIHLAELAPRSVLELGASRGDRLAALVERYNCVAVGVDPSAAAVKEGRATHERVEFDVGTIDSIPLDESFDVVIVNFVLHWVGRSDLLRSVAEIDRLVPDGGHLAIGDFLPGAFTKTPYHHRSGVWTFKQDYPALFAASGLYCEVASLAGGHGGRVPSGNVIPEERTAFTLLHKSLAGHYVTVDRREP